MQQDIKFGVVKEQVIGDRLYSIVHDKDGRYLPERYHIKYAYKYNVKNLSGQGYVMQGRLVKHWKKFSSAVKHLHKIADEY